MGGSPSSIFAVTTAAANLWTTSGTDDHLARPVLANDGSKWIAIYRSAPDHSTGGKIHIRFSENEGAAWSNEDTFTDSNAVTGAPFTAHAPNTNCGEGIVFVAPNGDILVHVAELGGTQYETYQYRSTDGGATFTDEGVIDSAADPYGGQDYTIDGDDMFITVMLDNWTTCGVYKSSDNGATWDFLSYIENTVQANETGIVYVGNNTLLAMMREWGAEDATYRYISTDRGVTWSARQAITEIGVVQRPRLALLNGGVTMVGRQGRMTSPPVQTVVWYSPLSELGARWYRKFHPDATTYNDAAYCDYLERSDGKFYMLSYGGSTAAAVIRSMVFEIA